MVAPLPQTPSPIVLDLFCGAGGMSLGFELARYTIGLGIEKDVLAWKTHHANFGGHCHYGSVESITDPQEFVADQGLERIDVIIGGPPCQGYSRVGRGKLRNIHNKRDYADPRNQYYRQFLRFIETLRPLYFVMENVPEISTYCDAQEDQEESLPETIRRLLIPHGYTVEWAVLKAHHYGVPQTRKRFFLIGNRLNHPIVWPEPTHADDPVKVWDAISDLPIVGIKARADVMTYVPRRDPLTPYQELMRAGAADLLYNHQTRWHNEQDLRAFVHLPEGGKYYQLDEEFKRYRDDIFKDKYRKLKRDEPSWTLEAHIGKDTYRHIYPSRVGEPEPPRTISVREAARLQSFPDRFRFHGPFTRQFMQIGNAVPPLLARAIAQAILPGVQLGMQQEAEAARARVEPAVP